MVEVLCDLFAEGEVDAARVVDEEAQRFLARLLERDQVELGVELLELLLDVILEVLNWHEAVKKVGQAHFGYIGTNKSLGRV
jgi:hypothetical protein